VPFVTEETFQQLRRTFTESDLDIAPPGGWPDALIIAPWPEASSTDEAAAADFERIRDFVTGIRAVRSNNKVEPGRYINAVIEAGKHAAMLKENSDILCFLARLDAEQLTIGKSVDAPDQAVTIAQGEITCYLPLAGMVDLAQERERLPSELAELEAQIERVGKLLDGPFAEKAPAAVVQKERDKLADLRASQAQVTVRLEALSA